MTGKRSAVRLVGEAYLATPLVEPTKRPDGSSEKCIKKKKPAGVRRCC
ncbi:hypothetical protein O9992_10700 [Vibrio lentus]|nr:hypothetical protein [Vibrio lentus]